MFENADSLRLAGFLLALCVPILGFLWGLVVYIFRRHEKENDRRFNENREDHKDIRNELTRKKDK